MRFFKGQPVRRIALLVIAAVTFVQMIWGKATAVYDVTETLLLILTAALAAFAASSWIQRQAEREVVDGLRRSLERAEIGWPGNWTDEIVKANGTHELYLRPPLTLVHLEECTELAATKKWEELYTHLMEIDKGVRAVNFMNAQLPVIQTSAWAVASSKSKLMTRILELAWENDVVFHKIRCHIKLALPLLEEVLKAEYKQKDFSKPNISAIKIDPPQMSKELQERLTQLQRVVRNQDEMSTGEENQK